MKIYLLLFLEFLRVIAKLLRPGGPRAIAAENLLLKQQLIVHSRSRKRAPKLSVVDRALFGFWTGFLNPRRLVRAAIVIKPATLLKFHAALVKKKYQLLYSSRNPGKPGPKGPSREVIDAVVAMKQRNPRYGCPRITVKVVAVGNMNLVVL